MIGVVDRDPAVLRVAFLNDVEVRHHLDPADQECDLSGFEGDDILELAIDPVADSETVALRVEVDVGRPALDRLLEDLVHQLGQRRGLRELRQFVAHVFLVFGAVG